MKGFTQPKNWLEVDTDLTLVTVEDGFIPNCESGRKAAILLLLDSCPESNSHPTRLVILLPFVIYDQE